MATKKTKPRGKPKRKPPPKMVIRRNAAPGPVAPLAMPVDATRNARRTSPPRPAISRRVKGMSGSHVAAGIGAGTVANALGVFAVAKRWIGPKATAGILMGTGAATAAAGWYWDADHLMAAGTGLAAAGTFSMANQLAVDAYEAAEKKAAEKRAEQEKAEREHARKLMEEEAAKRPQRNAPVFHVILPDDDAEADDADADDTEADDADADDRDEETAEEEASEAAA